MRDVDERFRKLAIDDRIERDIPDGCCLPHEGARDTFGKSLRDAKLQYKLKKAPVILGLHDATDAAKAVMHEFDARKRIFESVMTIVKRCDENRVFSIFFLFFLNSHSSRPGGFTFYSSISTTDACLSFSCGSS